MQNSRGTKREKLYLYTFFLLSSFLPLYLCSKCSPIYPLNDWPDINIFFTIGKGMAHGKAPYADLVDHKGPVVYLGAMIAYLISHRTFFGIFLMEVVNCFFFLFFSWKTLELYVAKSLRYVFLMPLLAAGLAGSKGFVHGGSMEEFCIGVYAYGLFCLLRFLRDDTAGMKMGTLIWNGLIAGILFWAKFTVLGFYIGWIGLLAFVWMRRKQWKTALLNVLIFGASFLVPTLPWIVYFGYHGAISEWISVYLFGNVFGGYAGGMDEGILVTVSNAFLLGFRAVKDPENLGWGLFLMIGAIGFLVLPRKLVGIYEKIAIVLLGAFSVLGIYIGGTLQDYYCLPLLCFCILGVILMAFALERCGDIFAVTLSKKRKKLLFGFLSVFFLLAGTGMNFKMSANRYLLDYTKEDMPQYRFAKIIEASDDTSLLNYAYLDGGFYTVLDEVPKVKYFCTMNFRYYIVLAEQISYLEERRTNWVVTWKSYTASEEELENLPILTENYELVDYVYFPLEGAYRTYALYQKKCDD